MPRGRGRCATGSSGARGDPTWSSGFCWVAHRSAASCLEMTRSSHTLIHDHELQGTESVLRRRKDFFHLSSRCLNDFLRFSALYPHGSSCHLLQNFLLALIHDLLKVIAWKALFVLPQFSLSFLLSEKVQTGLSVEAFKMICQVCFVSSFFFSRDVGVQLIFLCILGVGTCEMHIALQHPSVPGSCCLIIAFISLPIPWPFQGQLPSV